MEECAGSSSLCQSPPFSIYAQFFTMAQGNGGCTVTTSGSCTYYSSCTGGPQPNGVSAGTLTVSGPWLVPPVSVTPMTPTNTYSYTSSSPGFTAGQTLTVSASGAAVPAFGPVSVAAPQLTSIVQPPVDTDGGTTIVPTSGDLVVVWSGGQQGATMIFEATANNFASYTACTWNAADGKDVVPVAMLKLLSGQSGYLFYGQYNVTSFYSGPYAISLTALPYAVGAVNYQ